MQILKLGFYCSIILTLIIFLTACKKESDLISPRPSINSKSIESVKTWYEQQIHLITNEGNKNNFTLKTIKKSGIVIWDKTIWDGKLNSYVTPINIVRKNSNDTIQVSKYLITQIDERGLIKTGLYVYVISNKTSSNKQSLNSTEEFRPESESTATYIYYDLNNNFQSSKNYRNKQLTNKKDAITIKLNLSANDNSASPSVVNPNEEGCNIITIEWYWQTYINGVLVSEEYLFSTNEWVCPGGGGGSPPTTPNNPCIGADSLANNTEFKLKFDSLKMRTTINKEFAYYYKNTTANSIEESPVQGELNVLGIDAPPLTNPIDGYIHSHFKIPGRSVSIFSDYDMIEFIKTYQTGMMRNPLSFTFGVVTADTTQYLLKIDNLADFQNLVTKLTGPMAKLYYANYDQFVQANNTNQENEKGFLKFIQKFGSALKLFKGNGNFTNWQPVKLSNSNIINAPCN